jgi:TonB family protein
LYFSALVFIVQKFELIVFNSMNLLTIPFRAFKPSSIVCISTIFCFFLLKLNPISAQSDSLFSRVEQWPFFAGCAEFEGEFVKKRACSDEKLVEFISQKLVYPKSAIEKSVEGTVIVSFVVEINGSISQPTVVRDLGEGCGEAALNVVRSMPKWEAGRQKNVPVRVKMNLPIRFGFKKNEAANQREIRIVWGKISGEKVRIADLKNTIETPLFVRDQDGNSLKINELSFVFEKKKKSNYAKVNNTTTLDKSMRKVVNRASTGGTFTIAATIQEDGKFRTVEQTFLLIP